MNVDDAVRRFRRSVPGPSEELIERIIVSVTDSGRRISSRRRRPTGRGVLVVGSVTAAAVVLVAAGLLIRGGEGRDVVPAAPVTPPARVDWGQVATVRLKPDPGISVEEMRERFTAALAFRTHDHDGAGVEVVSARGDEVTVRLPGAEVREEVEAFLRFNRLVVVNEEDVLASGESITDVESEAARLIGPDTPVAYYVQSYLEGYGWSEVTRESSRTAAEKRMEDDPDRTEMIAVPADLVVVGGSNSLVPQPVGLIRPGPYVPSSSVHLVSIDGRRVTVEIDEENRPAAGSRVRVLTDPAGVVQGGSGSSQIGVADVAEDGRLSLDSRYSAWPLEVPRRDMGGTVDVADAGSYGRKPDAPGEPLPKALQPEQRGRSAGSEASSWRQLLTGRFDDRDYVLAAGMRANSIVAMMVIDRGRSTDSRGVISSGSWPSGDGDRTCPVGIGAPRVVTCGGSGGGGPVNGRKDGRYASWSINFGRVRPDVARIVMTYGGVQREAVIKDGWWLVHVTVDLPAPSTTNPGQALHEAAEADRSLGRPTIRAWDQEGNPVPVSPPESIRN